jgi:hypothetical protein
VGKDAVDNEIDRRNNENGRVQYPRHKTLRLDKAKVAQLFRKHGWNWLEQ